MQQGSSELCAMGIRELGTLYRARQLSPVEVTLATLERIARWNPMLRAYITVLEEAALTAARIAEHELLAGVDLGPLHGVPVGVKDIIRIRGTRTTAASRLLLDAALDTEDAAVVRRLRAAGAIVLGKLNLHEFARGEPDADSPFGIVQNPRRVGHHAGGSSSGSAAAVAAGLAVVALGTDTGGSVRLPAALCGVVGLKPTYGLVPSQGVIPLSPTLDHIGLLGRSAADVAAGLAVIADRGAGGPGSLAALAVPDVGWSLDRPVAGLRLGIPTNPVFQMGQPEALALLDKGKKTLIQLGAIQVPLEVPSPETANQIAKLITDVELWKYHGQFQGQEALYGRDFLEKSRPGLTTSAAMYARAREAQLSIQLSWKALFTKIDLLLLPGNVAGAPRHGQTVVEMNGEHVPVSFVTSHFDRTANMTGLPAVVLPVGATSEGLPIGLQLIGPLLSEARLLSVAESLEQALERLTAVWGIEPRRD